MTWTDIGRPLKRAVEGPKTRISAVCFRFVRGFVKRPQRALGRQTTKLYVARKAIQAVALYGTQANFMEDLSSILNVAGVSFTVYGRWMNPPPSRGISGQRSKEGGKRKRQAYCEYFLYPHSSPSLFTERDTPPPRTVHLCILKAQLA